MLFTPKVMKKRFYCPTKPGLWRSMSYIKQPTHFDKYTINDAHSATVF